MHRRFLHALFSLLVVASLSFGTAGFQTQAQATAPQAPASVASSVPQTQGNQPNDEIGARSGTGQMRTTTQAMRIAAALSQQQNKKAVSQTYAGLDKSTLSLSPLAKDSSQLATMAAPLSPPDYFGIPNWTNSPLVQLDANGTVIPGTGIRKFVDTLPGLCGVSPWGNQGANNLGQCIPVGIPDITTFSGSDYYEIALVEYREQMHPDLPAPGTKIRGYVQVVPASYPGAVPLDTAHGLTTNIVDRLGNQVYGATKPHYLGPTLLAQGCDLKSPGCTPRAVRVKFTNYLPTGPAGDLFIPVDPTYMGAGMGPGGSLKTIKVNNGGAGYLSVPTVVFTGGGGTGAAAVANVNNGKIISILITNGGSGYTTPPTVSFTGGAPTTPASAVAVLAGQPDEMYTENRATLHLHGGNTPWISDGTPHQWTTPYGELTSYSKGASVAYVPDMWFDPNGKLIASCAGQLTCSVSGASNDPGLGSLSFYWTNQESGRLLFYHDHSYGITRLNVYAGEAAGYLIVDPTEEAALAAAHFPGTIPDIYNLATADLNHLIPLVIQDKTYVPDNGVAGGQLAASDPTWDVTRYGGKGDMWLPHVWMPNQNPADMTGANAFGRWDYGPWFWPPQDPSTFVPSGQPYQCTSIAYQPPNDPVAFPPLMCPGIPNPSGVMEGMMDTPVINGAAYPTLTVDPTAYRFQMLMAGNDRAWNLGLYVAEPLSVAVTKGGSKYTHAPTITFSGGGGSGAQAVANMSNGSVTTITLTGVGHGYTIAPNVTITGDGIGAKATAVVDPVTTTILKVNITNMGSGYTYANVTIDPPLGCTTGCLTATGQATVSPAGTVLGITVTNYGTGWTSAPVVTITNAPGDTTGSGAAAIASINSEVKMIDAVPHTPSSSLPLCDTANPTSGAMLVTALLDGNGNPINGTGLQPGCWPQSWPTDGRDGGVPDPLTAGPPFIQIGSESGLLPKPVVIPSTPVGYEYNRKSITVLNVFTHGLLLGPAERADVIVDFSQYAGQTLLLYNDAPAPIPAFDPRNDYYTGDPDQTLSGGAPTTLPGYGPNTRTIMQIKVNAGTGGGGSLSGISVTNHGSSYTAPAVVVQAPPSGGTQATGTGTGSVDSVTLTKAGSGYSNPVITFSGGGGSGASAVMASGVVSSLSLTANGSGYASMPSVSFSGGGGTLAAATASGGVDAVTVTNGGSGYSVATPPGVLFSGGGGSGAAATAAVTGVGTINITSNGGGYLTMPQVTFTPATSDPGTGAAATATGGVDAIAVTTPGAGYTTPLVSIPGGATATATGPVDNIVLGNAGTGYNNPQVTLSGGGGSGATATATQTNGVITNVALTAFGSGYTSAPTVAITDIGPGTGAVATATQTGGTIDPTVTIVTNGTGYANPVVTVTDSGGNGSGAVITAQIDGTGAVIGCTVVNAGSNYVNPVLTITDAGLGQGASATTTISVTAINVSYGGIGYTSAPAITITDTGGTPTTPAVASATLNVIVVAMTSTGSGYFAAPTVVFSAPPAGGSMPVATAVVDAVGTVTVTNSGTGYSSAPAVNFAGGGATATATLKVIALTLTSGGSNYTTAPTISFSGGGGSGAAATAAISATGIQLTNGGTGYISAPTVTISDTPPGTGSGATATATINVTGITLVNPGSGYTSIPSVTINDAIGGAGTGATAIASIAGGAPLNLGLLQTTIPAIFTTQQNTMIMKEPVFPVGNGYAAQPTYARIQDTSVTSWIGAEIGSLTLTNPGSGYSSVPNVSITGGGGSGATAALLTSGGYVNGITLNTGGAGYSSAPTVNVNGGGGTGAAATALFSGSVKTITINNAGSGYTGQATVGFTGGNGAGATATATMKVTYIRVTNGGAGYTSAPTVTVALPSCTINGTTCVRATANATIQNGAVTAITVINQGSGYTTRPAITFSSTSGTGARAQAYMAVATVTVTNGGSGYTTPPTITFSAPPPGGLPSSVTATGTANLSGTVTGLLLTNGGSGYSSAPIISFTGGGTPTTSATATATILPFTITGITLTNAGYGYTSAPTVAIDPPPAGGTQATAGANPPLIPFQPKAIQELFTLDYGRMNATFGVEVPFSNFFTQTTIPYGYIDPPTEVLTDRNIQIWKITHNGVDTHFIHFHLFDVQVINRVGWDGMIKPPDDNEVAWKDTVRMNPLEDVIVALRPMTQVLPFELPNSVRTLDVTMPIGASNPNNTFGFTNIDPSNAGAPVTNDLVNFGWEYVWHCHILSHEEIDMMRPMAVAVPPDTPGSVTASLTGPAGTQSAVITWVDRSINESNFTIQRAISMNGPWLSFQVPGAPGIGTIMSYTDGPVAARTTYYYRVIANNIVGYTQTYAAPAVGYPTASADSAPAYPTAPVTTLGLNLLSVPVFADSFETGLNQWDGGIGKTEVTPLAVMGPHGGKMGLAATLKAGYDPKPSYLYDLSPNNDTVYDANFYFNPNGTLSDNSPIDIFIGLDQNGQPTFGVQYQTEGPLTYKLRGWVMQNGEQVFTDWDSFTVEEEEDDASQTHKIDLAWKSDTSGGINLYIDDQLFASLRGDTSAFQLDEVLLGPAMGITPQASGTLYFDEFTSSRINAVKTTINIYLPILIK